MPRLFVNNYSVKNISSKLNNLEDYYIGTNVKKMIFSPDGMFQIKGSNITKMTPVDMPTVQLDGFVIDNSYYDEQDVISQLPFDHHYSEIVEHRYCVDKKSCVHLVVEGIYTNNSRILRDNVAASVEQEKNKYVGFQPKSFYFWSLENLDNELISKEVNMLLTII